MIQLTMDVSGILAGLEEKGAEFRDIVAHGFASASATIVERFQDDQLSGRPGLNIKSGKLRDSIKSMVEIAQDQIKGIVKNEGATYWEYHQLGAGHNPKRLFFYEYFEDQGEKLYTSEIEMAFEKVAA